MARNRRNLPYMPVPTDLSRRRRIAPDMANFYWTVITKTGKIKRNSVKVKVDPNKNPIVLGKLIRYACNKIKSGLIPVVPNGFIFDDFGDFFHGVNWGRVRIVKTYKAGMEYER